MDDYSKLRVLRKAGRVRRFHTRDVLREETVGEHTFNSLLALLMIRPMSSEELMRYLLTHDLAEREVGDIPSPVKRKLGSDELHVMEMDWLTSYLPPKVVSEAGLVADELELAKTVDNLDGLLKCIEELELGNKDLMLVGHTYCGYLTKDQHIPIVGKAIDEFRRLVHERQ